LYNYGGGEVKKKIASMFLIFIMLICLIPTNSFASSKHKTIVINMNRSNFSDLTEIPTIKSELKNRGYVALMNVRGDQGTDDKRSYATIGAGGRVNTFNSDFKWFRNENKFKCKECEQCKDWKYCLGDSLHTWDFDNNRPKICINKMLGGK
jgi:hypothetical protein